MMFMVADDVYVSVVMFMVFGDVYETVMFMKRWCIAGNGDVLLTIDDVLLSNDDVLLLNGDG